MSTAPSRRQWIFKNTTYVDLDLAEIATYLWLRIYNPVTKFKRDHPILSLWLNRMIMYVRYEWNMKLFAFKYFTNFEDFRNQVPMFFRYPFGHSKDINKISRTEAIKQAIKPTLFVL